MGAEQAKTAVEKKPYDLDNAMLTGTIWKELLRFFFPLLLGTFFQLLYNTVDSMVVGQFVGTVGLSAVGGAAAQIINLMVGFFVGISSGATVVIAQYYGAARRNEVEASVHSAIAIALTGGAIFTVLGVAVAPETLVIMNTPADSLYSSAVYLRLYCLGMIPNMVYNMGSGILRAVGDSKKPTYYLIAGAVTNIVLDFLFVGGFHQGVAGAAIATVISQVVSAVLTLRALCTTDDMYRLSLRRIRLVGKYAGRIIAIGVPAGLRSMMYTFSNIIIQTAVNGFGTNTVAAWGASSRVDALYWTIIESLGTAMTTMIGQNYGAGLYKRVRSIVRQTFLIATIMTLSISGILFVIAPVMYRIFSREQIVIDIGVTITRYLAAFYWSYIGIEVFSGALIGMGDALIPTIITIIGVCVIRILWNVIMVPRYPVLHTVLLNYPITWIITSAAFVIYYFWYVHRKGIR